MRKSISIEKLAQQIGKDNFYQLYIVDKINLIDIGKKFNICNKKVKELAKYFGFERKRGEVNTSSLLKSEAKKKTFNNLLNRISKEELIKYYIEENHSYYETIEYFNITEWFLNKLIKKYGIKKTSIKINERISNYFSNIDEEKKQIRNDKIALGVSKSYSEERKQLQANRASEQFKGKKLSEERIQKIKEYWSNKEPSYWSYRQEKINNTKEENNSFNISNPEHKFYFYLKNIFKEVLTQYSDERYPFKCDFYIPSEDLFIELNLGWTHGGHPYNETNDYKILNEWKEKSLNSAYYKNAIYTWTDLDVRKVKQAECNNLNWLAFYNELDAYNYFRDKYCSKFECLLKENDIAYEPKFKLIDTVYDFKINNYLINVNNYMIDNINSISKKYHLDKTNLALDNGYKCINIWDWDDKEKIINILKPRHTIYARKCKVKELKYNSEAKSYCEKYHTQGWARCSTILGLYFEDELVSIMTFSKPRYNKNYEWELIRYCSHKNIIGGAEKLFKYFITNYTPTSIISYCDNSKFTGDTYYKLGFKLKSKGVPTCHWYNGKTHITDALLRQKGFSRLIHHCEPKDDTLNTNNNKQLMIEEGYFQIYDCGQSVFEYH